MSEFLHVAPIELMEIWGELVECYHGVNGYGSHIAEIYSYRLTQYSPTLHDGVYSKESDHYREQNRYSCWLAGRALLELVIQFCGKRDCSAKIDGMWPDDWWENVGVSGGFNHRAHVEIIKTETE